MPRSLVIPRPGGPPELTETTAGELTLVAAEVLPFDLQIAAGRVPGLPFPLRAGQAGIFRTAEGSLVSVQGGPVGFGLGAPTGTFAETLTAPETSCAALPDGLDPLAAAAGVSCVLSARLALAMADCPPGGRIAVTGATGGVGRAAAQLAASLGLQVIAVTRRAVAIEGTHTIAADQITASGPFDAIVDTVGGDLIAPLIAAGAQRCRHVVVGYTGRGAIELSLPSMLLREHQLLGFNAYAAPGFAAAHAQALLDLATGVVSPYSFATFGLADHAKAYEPPAQWRVLLVP